MQETNSIISLCIRDEQNPQRRLVAVRSQDEITHPNVVSMPTMRITTNVADALSREARFIPTQHPPFRFPEQIQTAYTAQNTNWTHHTGKEVGGHNELISVVGRLFADKLAVSLERCAFRARVGSRIDGILHYDAQKSSIPHLRRSKRGSEDVFEETASMLGIEVLVQNPQLFPSKTPSYSPIEWVDEGDYAEMLRTRSAAHLPQLGGDAVNYCVNGFCLLTTHIIDVHQGLE